MKGYALTLVGMAGAALLWTLLPKYDAAVVEWRPELGREEAIGVAVRVAAGHGEEIAGWRFAVTTEVDQGLARVKQRLTESEVAQAFRPLRIKVLARDQKNNGVQVTLSAEGRVQGYVDRSRMGRRQESAGAAEREFQRLAGEEAGRYKRTAESVKTQEGLRSAWEWVDPKVAGVLARVEVVTKDGAVTRSGVECAVAEQVMESLRSRHAALREGMLLGGLAMAIVLTVLGALSLFGSLVRRTDQLRFGMRFAVLAAVAYGADLLSGSYGNRAVMETFERARMGEAWLMQGLLVAVLQVVSVALILAAGYAAAPRWEWGRWVGASLASRGQVWSKPVGREVWNGLMGGVGLAAIPYVTAAAMDWGTRVRFVEGRNLLMEGWPQLQPLNGLGQEWEAYALVAFLLPWVSGRVRGKWAQAGILMAVGTLLASGFRGPFPSGQPWNLAVGAGLTAGFLGIYRLAGLLGLWVAPVGMYAAVMGVRLAHVAPVSLREAGWETLGLYGVAGAGALAVWALGKENDGAQVLREMGENAEAPPRSERERLKAEFEVARRAQAGMLPGEAPEIEGFEVSAVCEPAREVGGDLFDYLQFDDGQWGVCVADVSGKGVPAALYMTLTKGMLAAARRRKPDLRVIAGRLNGALVATGKRRVFVTMSMGLLDGAKQTFRHVRLGHNPPVVWRAATGECEFLMPKGIGLGLTGSGAFERHLTEHELQLEKGDALVLYSDGLVECMNERQQQYGEERLEEVLKEWGRLGAEGLKEKIVEGAREFRGGADRHDDLTVMVVKAGGRGRDSIR